jgi:hypothetical protein
VSAGRPTDPSSALPTPDRYGEGDADAEKEPPWRNSSEIAAPIACAPGQLYSDPAKPVSRPDCRTHYSQDETLRVGVALRGGGRGGAARLQVVKRHLRFTRQARGGR